MKHHGPVIDAFVFDLDGVLIDSEHVWDEVRQGLVADRGGTWTEMATTDMMGMSSTEWSAYLHTELGVPGTPEEINAEVVARMEARYRDRLPLLPGAIDAVDRMATRWPLAMASSSNRSIIELVLDRSGLADRFAAVVSSEEVERGKPAPDVYLEAVARLPQPVTRAAAVEDSSNGLRSAAAAGLAVVALPNERFPPAADALELASAVVGSLDELTVELVAGLDPA